MSPAEIADRADAAGFEGVARVLRLWAREPRGELADTLEAFADVHAIAALRSTDPRRHQRLADAYRRAATLLRAEAA